MRVVEFTGGSTGSSLAMVCAIKGYALHPLSSDAFAEEKLRHDARVRRRAEIMPSDGGKVTPALFDVSGAHRGARGGAEHVLDGSVQQRRCARRLREIGQSWSSRPAVSTRSAARSGRAAC